MVVEAILRSAETRTEFRGSYVRTGYPETDPDFQQNVDVGQDSVGGMTLSTEPVGRPSQAVQNVLAVGYELDYHQLE